MDVRERRRYCKGKMLGHRPAIDQRGNAENALDVSSTFSDGLLFIIDDGSTVTLAKLNSPSGQWTTALQFPKSSTSNRSTALTSTEGPISQSEYCEPGGGCLSPKHRRWTSHACESHRTNPRNSLEPALFRNETRCVLSSCRSGTSDL